MADPCIFSKLIVNPRAFECCWAFEVAHHCIVQLTMGIAPWQISCWPGVPQCMYRISAAGAQMAPDFMTFDITKGFVGSPPETFSYFSLLLTVTYLNLHTNGIWLLIWHDLVIIPATQMGQLVTKIANVSGFAGVKFWPYTNNVRCWLNRCLSLRCYTTPQGCG